MERNLPQLLIGVAIGLSFSFVAYRSGKSAGANEVSESISLVSTGNHYQGLRTYYQASRETLDADSRELIETFVREAHKEFSKHLAGAKKDGSKYLGLIAQIDRDLPEGVGDDGGQDETN